MDTVVNSHDLSTFLKLRTDFWLKSVVEAGNFLTHPHVEYVAGPINASIQQTFVNYEVIDRGQDKRRG